MTDLPSRPTMWIALGPDECRQVYLRALSDWHLPAWRRLSGTRQTLVDPAQFVCYQLLCPDVIEHIVIVPLIELQRLILRACLVVERLTAARLGHLVRRAM